MTGRFSFKVATGILLFLSLTLNVFLGGMVAGNRSSEATIQRLEKLATTLSAFRELSPASREKAKAILKRDWPEIKQRLAEIRDTRAEVKEMLSRPEYDRAALEGKFADLRRLTTEAQTRGQTMAADIADAITPEERLKLVRSGG